MSSRVVTSAATTATMWVIPTGINSPITITNQMVLHVEKDGHTYNDPDNDTVLDSYGNKNS